MRTDRFWNSWSLGSKSVISMWTSRVAAALREPTIWPCATPSCRKGDVLVVKSIDRFGRNYSAIRAGWEFLTKTLGVDIVVLDTPISTPPNIRTCLAASSPISVLAVLSFGAQLEVDTKSKAQAEGIAAAHLKGVKFGRPRCTVEGWDTYYPQWKQGQITAVQCHKQLGISASTFYRLVRKYELEDESE